MMMPLVSFSGGGSQESVTEVEETIAAARSTGADDGAVNKEMIIKLS